MLFGTPDGRKTGLLTQHIPHTRKDAHTRIQANTWSLALSPSLAGVTCGARARSLACTHKHGQSTSTKRDDKGRKAVFESLRRNITEDTEQRVRIMVSTLPTALRHRVDRKWQVSEERRLVLCLKQWGEIDPIILERCAAFSARAAFSFSSHGSGSYSG